MLEEALDKLLRLEVPEVDLAALAARHEHLLYTGVYAKHQSVDMKGKSVGGCEILAIALLESVPDLDD